jgi:p-aminobenzoyl-glutamate transporter AbgT
MLIFLVMASLHVSTHTVLVVGQTVALIAGILTGLAVIVKKTGLGRAWGYVWSHLVSNPLAEWFKGVTSEVVDDRLNYTNDGDSFRDQVNKMSTVASQNAEGIERNAESIEGLRVELNAHASNEKADLSHIRKALEEHIVENREDHVTMGERLDRHLENHSEDH